jgi:spore coat polysaccharide biosynthesis protein SpsF
MDLYETHPADLVTNVHPRTYPPGQSVEILKTATFLETFTKIRDPYDQEHVTPYFYKHAETFSIIPFKASRGYSNIHLAVDTKEDMERITRLILSLETSAEIAGLDDIVTAYRRMENQKDDRHG